MNNSKLILRIFIAFVFFTFANGLKAQYIIEQIEYEIPVSYELIPEDAEFERQEDEINYILNIPESKLKEAALAEGLELKEEKSTIYIDGDNFAVETESEDTGKMTMLSDMKTGVMYVIMWTQKKVVEMKQEDMDEMAEESKAMSEKMLENLSPEIRKQVMAEMQKEKNKSPLKYDVLPTGKKKKIYGFNCEEYRVNKGEDVITIWASNDKSGVLKEVSRISKKLDELSRSSDDEEVDEWQLVPGKIPVQVVTYTYSMMMGDPILAIQAITKIEKKKPSADKFRVPGKNEGFTSGSMMDMMQIMPGNE